MTDEKKVGNNKGRGKGGDEGKKKRKNKSKNDNLVKNISQQDEFKVADGKLWKGTFAKHIHYDCPVWNSTVKMCACWHINGKGSSR